VGRPTAVLEPPRKKYFCRAAAAEFRPAAGHTRDWPATPGAGGTSVSIIRRHVWPNIMRILAAQFAIAVSLATITAAILSFLGLLIPPPTGDWGGMARAGFEFLALNPAMSLAPGAATAITVMGIYHAGSAVE
jgi:peptide/nickel transport system permease protein